jgi:hypothetical protein
MSTPFIEMPQRELASPSITSRPPWPDPHHPGHDVLGEALPGVAVDGHAGRLVHAGAVVADVAVDRHLDRPGQAGGDRMGAAWMEHPPEALVGVGRERVERAVELADRGVLQIDRDHVQCRAQL